MPSDEEKLLELLTIITNEPEANLLNRFRVLIKDAKFFDSLVGYLYTSEFYNFVK